MTAFFLHGKEKEIRKFGATTPELLKLSDRLANSGCQKIAMESTGSYWKTLYKVIEEVNNACFTPIYELPVDKEDAVRLKYNSNLSNALIASLNEKIVAIPKKDYPTFKSVATIFYHANV